MAYAQTTPDVRQTVINGRRHWRVVFTETEVAAGSTGSITGLPTNGTITLLRVAPTYTTAATVRPVFGRTVGWTAAGTDANHIGQVSAAAAGINDATNLRYSGLVAGEMFYRTVPNAGSDTVTTVEMVVVEGHI